MNDFEISKAYVEDARMGRYYQSGLASNLLPERKLHLRYIRHSSSCRTQVLSNILFRYFKFHTHPVFDIFLILAMCYHCSLAFAEPVQVIGCL